LACEFPPNPPAWFTPLPLGLPVRLPEGNWLDPLGVWPPVRGRFARLVPLVPCVPVDTVRFPVELAEGVNGLLFWHPVSATPARKAPASPSKGFLIILISPETVVVHSAPTTRARAVPCDPLQGGMRS
jgi:hypothetical protein